MEAYNELSDSDSGDTWTILDHSPIVADDLAQFREQMTDRNVTYFNLDKDEDTDGISIISDSESDSPEQPEHSKTDVNITENQHETEFIALKSDIENSNLLNDDMNEDLLGNNNNRHKTYVHKRNKRLSIVLNIIVLSSIITAAGVAIGHTWGTRNDCSVDQTTQSINKILSDLYRLQEENAYLRSKLKEVILMNNINITKRKSGTETVSKKSNTCKKVYEDSIYTKNTETPIKCVENVEITKIDDHLIETKNDIEFLNDLKRLQKSNKYNRDWLDYENSKRLDEEEMKLKILKKERNSVKDSNLKTSKLKGEYAVHILSEAITNIRNNINEIDPAAHMVLNADSNQIDTITEFENIDPNVIYNNENKYRTNEDIVSDDKIIKGNEHDNKKRHDRKKYGRKKPNKKQKRNDKKWEIQYLKNSEDVSIKSTQEAENSTKTSDSNISNNDIKQNCFAKGYENELINSCNNEMDENFVSVKNNLKYEVTWFDKRADNRNEARKKLKYEMFRKSNSSVAGWYFRHMRRRERYRAENNNINKKLSKRNKNFIRK